MPDPVGATTSACCPEEIASHAPACAAVGSLKEPLNHAAVAGENRSRTSAAMRSTASHPAPTLHLDRSGALSTAQTPSRQVGADRQAGGMAAERVHWRVVVPAAALQAVALTLGSVGYGYHRDELYFRMLPPAWGYVDQPPLTPLLARLTTHLADEPWALRLPATIAAALSVVVVALVCRELGGRRGPRRSRPGATPSPRCR